MNKKAKTRNQLAQEYGLHRNTLKKYLQQAGITKKRGLLSPREVRIFEMWWRGE